MGLLIKGKWVDEWYDTKSTGGSFVRTDAQFRNWITPDGSPGQSGEGGFPAEAGPLPPLYFAGLSMGASHTDFSRAERLGRHDKHLRSQLLHGRPRLDLRSGSRCSA